MHHRDGGRRGPAPFQAHGVGREEMVKMVCACVRVRVRYYVLQVLVLWLLKKLSD